MSSESNNPGAQSKRYGEYVQDQTTKKTRYRLKDRLKDSVASANRMIAHGDYHDAAVVLRDVVIPTLGRYDYALSMPEYHEKLHHDDEYEWHWESLRKFLREPDRHVRLCDGIGGDGSSLLRSGISGRDPGGAAARRVVEEALISCESIASWHSITSNNLRARVDTVGFSGKIGEHLQDEEMDIGDPLLGHSEQAGALKTLFCGGTGLGKSTGMETEAEDYYRSNFTEGRSFKLLDLVGLRDGENWFYDIPQQQKALRRIRENQGLPADFVEDESEEFDRRVEILAPLTPGLADEELPFDTDDGEFVVRPFTVPASELSKPLLVSLIMSRLSEGEEQTVRMAYDDVSDRKDDWSLKELADEIRGKDELSPKHKSKAIGVIRGLQNEGFIRTHEDEHTIDWRDIFNDTETITLFTQAFCRDKISALVTFAYLVNAIHRARETMYDIPPCVLLMRELWKVCPHKQRQSFDARTAALQEAIGQMLAEIFRENRHSGIHLLADTQQPSDLLKPVREMFNRYVVFSANKDTIKDIFSWTANDRWRSFWNTMTPKAGEAGIVGQVQPAIDNRDIEFLSPVAYAPPSHHHRDADKDLTGWHARCKYLEAEELRRPAEHDAPWDDSLPLSLEVEPVQDPDEQGAPDPKTDPVGAFADRCLEYEKFASVKKEELVVAFNEFMLDNGRDSRWDFDDRGVQVRFGKQLKNHFGKEIGHTTQGGETARKNIRLNSVGRKYAEKAMDGLEDASAPIQG